MLSQNRRLLAVAVTLVALPVALLTAAEAPNKTANVDDKKTPSAQIDVELFQGMADGTIEVEFIAQDDTEARLIIKNKAKQPINVALPEAFAGIPVLAQFGRGGGGRGGGGFGGGGGGRGGIGGGGGGQGLGGGGGIGGRGGGGRGGRGGGRGGRFNIAPEKVAKIRIPCVCLDHGKPDPNPRMKYQIVPIESYVDQPAVIELIREFGNGKMDRKAAQAAVWHLNSDLTWEELAAKTRGSVRLGTASARFTPDQLRQAVQIAEAARRVAEEKQPESHSPSKSSLSAYSPPTR